MDADRELAVEADEVQDALRDLADTLEPAAFLSRISCNFQDGAVVPPVTLTEYRIPPGRIQELLDRQDFGMPADLYPALARVCRLLALNQGRTGLIVEYDQERNVKWLDRVRNVE